MTIIIAVDGWLRHLGLLGFVSWVSLILCFADSFCFVKSVPAGIPELGVYSYFRSFRLTVLMFRKYLYLLCKIQCLVDIPARKPRSVF
jgi:hypothetical protein